VGVGERAKQKGVVEMNMLKASALRGKVVEIEVKKIVGNLVYPLRGSVDRIDTGYTKYFKEDETADATKWINHQRKRWGKKLLTKKEITDG